MLVAIVPTTPFVALRRPVSVPMPRLVVVAFVKSALTKCEVEEAKIPAVANRGVEVAEVLTPKFSVGVKGQAKTFAAVR